ncbi:hypothetical protein AX17_001307 [Amanita inopinata Kibby_2008]|nr:hypothetical protein AX17_001307 [Amanita inopinata Kibby_2008]
MDQPSHSIPRDMPPPGGFEAIKYKRNLPVKGPGAYAILGGVTAICAYGFYRVGKGNLEKRWVAEIELCHAQTNQLDDPAAVCPQSLSVLAWLRELQREKVWSRIHLVPLLMAEGDRDAYRRQQAALAREREIMKDVPGWEAGKSVYNNSKYHSPNIVVL